MKHSNIIIFLLAVILGGTSTSVWAQDFSKSDKVFEWFQADEADSIYALFSAPVKAQLQVAQLKGMYNMLTLQAGTLQSADSWTEQEVQGLKVHDRVLRFSNTPLTLRLAYLPTGELAGLFFLPVEEPATSANEPEDTTTENFTLVNDQFQLPATFQRPFVKKNAMVRFYS
ncbi:MAG: DUF3887 domain-containing protein [Alloprevotella sp.]|nr:DUF3887 domain-containing protein [Alloprevotella sp.]